MLPLITAGFGCAEATRNRLDGAVAELRQHEAELDSRNASMVANIAELETSRDQLQQSVAEVSERNADLLQTADKLREVLKIAGEGSESLKEVGPTALSRLWIVRLC